jgi:mono/diheme cytochrome c family protein
MDSDHQVAKGFWLTFGGGSLIAVLLVAVFVWADSTGSSGGKASASPGTTAAPATTETLAGSTETTTETSAASTAETTGGGTVSAAAGKKVFTTNCGSCHTLADAGTSGNVGPNLDDLKPDTATVQHQVENGGGGMPAFAGQLTASEIAAVAKYVSSVAGKGGDAGGTEPPAGGMP